jgi:sugar lactone lactonase YvrE
MGTRLLCVALVFVAACTCGNNNNVPDASDIDARWSDAPPADARPADAPFDASVADADFDAQPPDGAPDAPPPDAALPDGSPDAGPPLCPLPPFTLGVSTVAGCDLFGDTGGARGFARFHNPANVAVAADGTIYVADFDNDLIRRVTPAGDTTTLVDQINFQRPFGLAFGNAGELYVQTDDNASGMHTTMTGTIWQVDLVTGVATPIIENIGRPRGIVVLGDGRIATSDYLHHVLQIVDPVPPATVTPLAGGFDMPGYVDAVGAAARFNRPYGMVVLLDGTLAVAELENHRIRRVALDGTVSLLAGTGTPGALDGDIAVATFNAPQDLAIDATGRLYVADTNNYKIRRIAGSTVDTVAGAGTVGYLDSDDPLMAQIFGLEGIALSPFDGKLYIADGTRGEDTNLHNRIRVTILP